MTSFMDFIIPGDVMQYLPIEQLHTDYLFN